MSFPRYPAYKPSGVEWLGEVPAHWDIARLKRAFRVVGGSTPKSDNDAFWDGEIAWVTPADLSGLSSWEIRSSQRTITKTGLASCGTTLVPPNSIVISTRAPIGSLGIAAVGLCTNQGCRALVPITDQSPRFATYVLSVATPELNTRGKGTTFLELSGDELGAFVVPFPPKAEQTTIAAFLDRETGKIDALVAEQEKLIALLKEKRQALISHAVTKGLNPDAPMKPSGIDWLGDVPAHWVVGGLTKFIGPVVDYRGRTPTKLDEGMFLVTAKNIRDGAIDYAASEEFVDPIEAAALLARGAPEIGDVLFTTEAPLGQVAQIDRTGIALAQRVVKFRGIPDVVVNRYLMYWLMGSPCQSRLETLATGSTALGIKASKLGMIELLVPPCVEQQAIVEHIDTGLRDLESLQTEADRAITLLKERRAALISAAVTGKIDVRSEATVENATEAITA